MDGGSQPPTTTDTSTMEPNGGSCSSLNTIDSMDRPNHALSQAERSAKQGLKKHLKQKMRLTKYETRLHPSSGHTRRPHRGRSVQSINPHSWPWNHPNPHHWIHCRVLPLDGIPRHMESLFPRPFGIVTDPGVSALEQTHGLAIAPVFELLSLFWPSALSFGTRMGARTLAIDLWSGWKSPIHKILCALLSKIHHLQSVLLPLVLQKSSVGKKESIWLDPTNYLHCDSCPAPNHGWSQLPCLSCCNLCSTRMIN